jgi:DNA topoisomerase VI subunit A
VGAVEETIINGDKTISLKSVANLPAFQFLRILLEDIIEYENSEREKKLKQMKNIDPCLIYNAIVL